MNHGGHGNSAQSGFGVRFLGSDDLGNRISVIECSSLDEFLFPFLPCVPCFQFVESSVVISSFRAADPCS